MRSRIEVIKGWGRIVAGLMVFAGGVHLTIYANIGLAPWDCLGMGLSYHTPLNYGLSMTLIALTVLIIDLLLKERVGYRTIIDALLTGNFVQMFNSLNPFPENHNLWFGIALMLVGFILMALGMAIYMSAEQCCGPRGLGKRMSNLPIGFVEILLWAAVLVAGWSMGGPVGIGTLISTVGAGAVMHVVYSIIRFEPRELDHRSVIETTKSLIGN